MQTQADPADSTPDVTGPTRPTTQELLDGERVTLSLDILPLRMKVPTQWKITRPGSSGRLVVLEGPTPGGLAQINLKHQDPPTPKAFEQLLMGARRDNEPDTEIEVRQLGSAHVIERIGVGRPMNMPVVGPDGLPELDDKGEIQVQSMVPMRWRINVYVPMADHVENYELNFLDLSEQQYGVDKDFLRGILSTLEYAGPSTAPADATPAELFPPPNR